ncbi:hypothetical protein ciss_11250 [Carboxydothermus islandicus]|uniref:Uncharacterized protein n=1 Tax=Carboxydothermus islandicus TaxID=661089 RepID=A0A1L8D1Z4_9THEO|nr:hypothetical protein ciss_11250 [Carboxydothermus islandicus]
MDKTVPTTEFREHKGLFWILNFFKVRNQDGQDYNFKTDYFGFFPKGDTYEIKEISGLKPDLIYLADTYGVYTDDLNKENKEGTRSKLIYGGLTETELFKIKANLQKGTTIVSEFNTIEYPTSEKVSQELQKIFGFKWSGWIGRYYVDLKKGMEVPTWVIKAYENQYHQDWNFEGGGFVFIYQDNTVLVLEDKKDFTSDKLQIKFRKNFAQKYGAKANVNYYYWFEILSSTDSTVIADFNLHLTSKGAEKLKKYNLPATFPAILKKSTGDYTAYYFAGDFADTNNIPSFYKYSLIPFYNKHFKFATEGNNEAFFWQVYLPVMKTIINETKHYAVTPVKPEYFEDRGTKLIAKIEGQKFKVYHKGKWQDFYIKGVNLGLALPGKWFTEMPQDEGTYLDWFTLISGINANTVRLYTLAPPAFYRALKYFNETQPDKPLYLMQEIWPEENPPEQNYLNKEYFSSFKKEIENVINAIHGKADIPERKGRAYGKYDADVSYWTIAYLVGRELEPEEVISTNEKNKDYKFTGEYLLSHGSPTESWLAESCDYVLKYEDNKYKMQHPVAIVSWPTLDPIEHDSEYNVAGRKDLEYNDKVSVNINNFDTAPKNKAGFFGAYHIYPNYPDFMNNEEKYMKYYDEQGRFMYGGYLKEFIAVHRKFPALVAEFGLSTGMGNAHTNPDGYNHGGLDEITQGKGIVRMMEAIKREGYIGGSIFEWIDEWAKKTWLTEPFMIPYERHVLWHNAIDPEQNYGILAFETLKPETGLTISDSGNIKSLNITNDETYLYLDIEFAQKIDLAKDELLIGLDTYDRNLGEYKYEPGLNLTAPSGMEFLLKLQKGKLKILAHPSYNIGDFKFASQKSYKGVFTEIRPLINKERVTKDGRHIKPIYQDGSTLNFGDFTDSSHAWYVEGNMLYIRLPWNKLNFTDPSSKRVLHDPGKYNILSRDQLKTTTTNGIVVTLILKEGGKVVDLFPGENNFKLLKYSYEGWEEPKYTVRLKKSYEIIKEYFKTLN